MEIYDNCYWSWPKPVADIFKKYAALIDPADPIGGEELLQTLCHVVWADENFHCWKETLENWDVEANYYCSPAQEEIAKQSLAELGVLDPEVRDCIHHRRRRPSSFDLPNGN